MYVLALMANACIQEQKMARLQNGSGNPKMLTPSQKILKLPIIEL